jgi:hypothetical protein
MYNLDNTENKLEEALKNSVSLIFTENEETINRLNDIKKVAGWYKEAKEDPDKIPSIIINNIIEELLKRTRGHFIYSITEKIKIQCQINLQQPEVKGNIQVNFESIKPYIEFIKVVDGVKVPPRLRFTFKIDIDGVFEGFKVHSSPFVASVVGMGERKKREISLDKFSFDLTISIIKLPAFNLVVPIVLYHNEQFKVENLSFYI